MGPWFESRRAHHSLDEPQFREVLFCLCERKPLILGGAAREARGEPVFPYATLCAATEKIGVVAENQILVPGVGIEPTRAFNSSRHFKCRVSTSFTTPAPRTSYFY